MWQLEVTVGYERTAKWYEKKRKKELAAVLANLQRYLEMLAATDNPQLIQAGFLHSEQKGVWAIDQRGWKEKLQQTRLYTFPDYNSETLYLLRIGNKDSQPDDVKWCSEWVDDFRENANPSNSHE